MSEVTLPGTIGAANILGGVDEMRVRLLSRRQFLVNPDMDNFALTGTIGLVGSGWFAGGGSSTKVHEPDNIFGRYAAEIEDDAGGDFTYLGQDFDLRGQLPGGELNGNAVVFTAWLKATSGDTDFMAQLLSRPNSPQTVSTGVIALSFSDWTFIALVATFSTAAVGDTALRLRLYPAIASGPDLGTVRMVRPRVHVQREELTGFPRWPLRDLVFRPWLGNNSPRRNGLGQLPIGRRSIIHELVARHPITNKAQIDQVSALSQHDGPVLVEPSVDSAISFLMIPSTDDWAYAYLQDRAIGYEGSIRLEGLDPIMGIPDAARYYETETIGFATFPQWRMAVKP